MLYAIPDTLLKVAFNINKTGHHVIRYNWHIVESGVLTPIKLASHQVIRCTWHIVGGGVQN